MAKRSVAEIYSAARNAGLSVANAVLSTAVALAESKGDDRAVGDVSLQTSKWGPSVGVWQIRTLKAETGTGSDRDIQALQGNLARQAQAMKNISNGGTNFTPWTMYNNGTYRNYIGQAASASSGALVSPVTDPTVVGVSNPVAGVISGEAAQFLSDSVKPARDVLLKLGFVALGLGIVGVGLWNTVGHKAFNEAKDALPI